MKIISAREQRTRETKARIYEATKQILKEYGFKYVTVRNVCEEANVTQGAFYHHFDNKEKLLSAYGTEVFEKMLVNNPLPREIDEVDYIKVINWYLYIYCQYCVEMGCDFVKYHFDNCVKDIFYEICFPEHIKKAIKLALEHGYMNIPEDDSYHFLIEDIENIYTGIIRRWCNQPLDHSELSPLDAIMYRIMIRFLLSFSSESYQATYMLREKEDDSNGTYDYQKRFKSFHR